MYNSSNNKPYNNINIKSYKYIFNENNINKVT